MKTLFSSKNRKRQKQYTIQNKHTNSGCVKIFALLPFFFSQKEVGKIERALLDHGSHKGCRETLKNMRSKCSKQKLFNSKLLKLKDQN